jgi:hypothetical protein
MKRAVLAKELGRTHPGGAVVSRILGDVPALANADPTPVDMTLPVARRPRWFGVIDPKRKGK